MDTDPVTVSETDSVETVVRLLHENEVRGLPVVADDRKVVGIVTENDLLLYDEQEDIDPPPHLEIMGGIIYLGSVKHWEERVRKSLAGTVGDLMTYSVPANSLNAYQGILIGICFAAYSALNTDASTFWGSSALALLTQAGATRGLNKSIIVRTGASSQTMGSFTKSNIDTVGSTGSVRNRTSSQALNAAITFRLAEGTGAGGTTTQEIMISGLM